MRGLRTLTDCCRGDEGALCHGAGSLLSNDSGNRVALCWLAEWNYKLAVIRTDTLSVWENMVTDVGMSIECCEAVELFGMELKKRSSWYT